MTGNGLYIPPMKMVIFLGHGFTMALPHIRLRAFGSQANLACASEVPGQQPWKVPRNAKAKAGEANKKTSWEVPSGND